jgi:hypothetical protein
MDTEFVNPDYLYRGSARFHPRALLAAQQAIEIYSHRIPSFRGKIAIQAKNYNVSPKTIRDILNRRTWTKETRHLWAQDEQASIRAPKIKATERYIRAKSLYQTNGAAPAVLVGEHLVDQLVGNRNNCGGLACDEWSDSNSSEPLTSSSNVTISAYPMDLQLAPPSEPMPHRFQPDTHGMAWTAAVFLPEAYHLDSTEAGTSDDPFHFDWPHW